MLLPFLHRRTDWAVYLDKEAEGAGGKAEETKPGGEGTGTAVAGGEGAATKPGESKGGKAAAVAGEGEGAAEPGWKDRRIGELTGNWREEQRQNTEAKRQLDVANATIAELRAGKGTEGMLTKAQAEDLANARAVVLAQQMDFNKECDKAVSAGRAEFDDFDARLNSFRQIGGMDPQNAKWANFITAALETGEAHRIIHDLGGDLDQASKIMEMPPLRMVAAMTKLVTVREDTVVTKTPKPLRQTRGSAKAEPTLEDTEMSTDEWMKMRDRDVQAKRKAGLSIQ